MDELVFHWNSEKKKINGGSPEGGRLSEGLTFPVVDVSLSSLRKASCNMCIWCIGYSYNSNCIRITGK